MTPQPIEQNYTVDDLLDKIIKRCEVAQKCRAEGVAVEPPGKRVAELAFLLERAELFESARESAALAAVDQHLGSVGGE